MASFASSATTGGARKHAWTKNGSKLDHHYTEYPQSGSTPTGLCIYLRTRSLCRGGTFLIFWLPSWILVQARLRAPHVVAYEAKLAIVFTYFWSRRACVRHTWWRTKQSWPLFSPTFFFFFFLSFFFLLRLLLFTHFGETPVRENLFPPIFWHN